MKYFFPIVFSLLFIPVLTVNPTKVARSNNEIITQAIKPGFKKQIEQNSVQIIHQDHSTGLGIILSKQGNKYLVLTSSDLIKGNETFTVKTVDGQAHPASLIENAAKIATSLRLLEFSSEQDYIPAELNPAAQVVSGQNIFIVGNEQTKLNVAEEKVGQSLINSSQLEWFGYENNIISSSAVRGIFNSNGTLVGFSNGKANSFVTLNSFLQQVNQDVTIAYDIKLLDTAKTIKPKLTGQLKVLEDKAKEITVKIKSSSGALGSGVIVKRDGDVYTILTSSHVVCEQNDENSDDGNCAENHYKIITSKNQSTPYQVSRNSIKSAEKVDLARLEFTSTNDYQVATLADYAPVNSDGSSYASNSLPDNYTRSEQNSLSSRSDTIVAQNLLPGFSTNINFVDNNVVYKYERLQNHFVFAAGYAAKISEVKSEWKFNLGYALNRKTGSYNIYDRSSFDNGYELVYTAITHKGMSGGPILDIQGKVIGIHGKAEGDSNTDVLLGYSLAIPIGKFAANKSLAKELELDLNLLDVQRTIPDFTYSLKSEFEQTILTTEIPSHNISSCEWIDRGNQLWRLLKYEDANLAFQHAIDRPDTNCIKLAWYGKGLSLWRSILTNSNLTELEKRKEYKQAAKAFKQAAQYDPKFSAAIRREAVMWITLKKFRLALNTIDKAIKLEPNNHSLHNDQGALLTKLGKYTKAKSVFDKAIDLNDSYYLSYYNRGLINAHGQGLIHTYGQGESHDNKEHLNAALADFDKAIEYEPKSIPLYLNRGNVYYHLNKISEAQDNYKLAILLAEKNRQKYPPAHHNLGYIFDKQKKYKLALVQYDKAIDEDSEYCIAYINRGRIYAIQKKWNNALKDYDRAIELCDIDPEIYLSRGLIHYKLGDKFKAIGDLQIAITHFSKQNNLEGKEKAEKFLQQIK